MPPTQFKIIGNVFGNWIFVWIAIARLCCRRSTWPRGRPPSSTGWARGAARCWTSRSGTRRPCSASSRTGWAASTTAGSRPSPPSTVSGPISARSSASPPPTSSRSPASTDEAPVSLLSFFSVAYLLALFFLLFSHDSFFQFKFS